MALNPKHKVEGRLMAARRPQPSRCRPRGFKSEAVHQSRLTPRRPDGPHFNGHRGSPCRGPFMVISANKVERSRWLTKDEQVKLLTPPLQVPTGMDSL